MNLKLMTPTCLYVDEDVESVTIPTKTGEITVMPGHDFVITVLKRGRLHFVRKHDQSVSSENKFIVGDGCAEITHDGVIVFAKAARREEVLDGYGKGEG